MKNVRLTTAVAAALFTVAVPHAFAQRAETVSAPVVSQPGPTSSFATPGQVPFGTVLLDEGTPRLISSPTGGPGGAPASVLQDTSLGMTIFGFGASVASGFRVAEDFTVPAQGWSITRARFYTYQTGSTTTSTINDLRVQVFSGTPGGTSVFGDATTNRLTSTTFSTVYRTQETAPTASNRPIMEVVAEFDPPINITTPGTYWIAWSYGGTLASGPWSPPQTVAGQAVTGNCQQFDGAALTWGPALDGTNAQGCAFVLEGATLPVTLQSFGID